MIDGADAVSLTEKVVGGIAAIGASFYLVERAIRFNVDISDKYKEMVDRLETKIADLERRGADLELRETEHLAKIQTLEEQVTHLTHLVETMRLNPPATLPPPKPPPPPRRKR